MDNDYIFGPEGAKEYRSATGKTILPGQDGCYISIQKNGSMYQVGTDYAGYKKIFYYNQNGIWAISNSIHDLALHLKEEGVELTLNYPQLISLKIKPTIATQTSCFKTIFNEIKLLPSFLSLIIKNNKIEKTNNNKKRNGNYPVALKLFLDTWVSRFETLIRDERINISADLTGGVDSRAVFAILQKAIERSKSGKERVLIRSGTEEHWEKDFLSASKISEHYGIELNQAQPPSKDSTFSTKESYQLWKLLCLGTYLPIYFPGKKPNAFNVHFNGGGGENHRPFYPECSPEEFLSDTIEPVTPYFLFENWKLDFLETTKTLTTHRPDIHPLISHYREFRNRMHGGRAPQYRVVMSPLNSHLLENISGIQKIMSGGQINFDIMENLLPGIMKFEYDSDEKSPTEENFNNLTIIELEKSQSKGKVYIGDKPKEEESERRKNNEILYKLNDEYTLSKTNLVREFLGDSIIKKGDKTMKEAFESGKFLIASNAKDISRVMTVHFAFKIVGLPEN